MLIRILRWLIGSPIKQYPNPRIKNAHLLAVYMANANKRSALE